MKRKVSLTIIFMVVMVVFFATIISAEELAQDQQPSYWPTTGWQRTTPESQGFYSAKLSEGLLAIKEQGINIHSLMIIRNGSVFLNACFYPYDGSTYHNVASVTKSVMTTLIGIAADQGKIDLDQPVLSFFPERTIANRSPLKEQITVRHLVSNSSGFRFDERDDSGTISKMTESEDWIQAALDPPVVHQPGTHFAYYSPGMHLLSVILQEVTGMTAQEFANTYLFQPLGIKDYYWLSDPQGYTRGWADLCLFPSDMAKIGFLFLQRGRWEGRQIVSSQWVKEATKKQLPTGEDNEGYGYGWWISSPSPEEVFPYYRAYGRNEQIIMVFPSINTLIVTTGGGFDFDEIAPYLVASIGDLEHPLPENQSAVEELTHITDMLKSIPEPERISPLPETAGTISGKTFKFKLNALGVESFSITFENEREAILKHKLFNESVTRTTLIGLDGRWRPSVSGYPAVSRGYWEDDQSFILEYDEGPGLKLYRLQIIFEKNKVFIKVVIPESAAGLTIDGNVLK